MTRLVIVGNGKAADSLLRQIGLCQRDFPITVFGVSVPSRTPEWYQSRGIDLHAGVRIVEIDRHALVVHGDDGSRTPYEHLVLATGKRPLPIPGLQRSRGVLVNRNLETSDGHIFAIGDCAEHRPAETRISLEKHARLLAKILSEDPFGDGRIQRRDPAIRRAPIAPGFDVSLVTRALARA
jgi:NAD(P)H-nitrite reductase large subunit